MPSPVVKPNQMSPPLPKPIQMIPQYSSITGHDAARQNPVIAPQLRQLRRINPPPATPWPARPGACKRCMCVYICVCVHMTRTWWAQQMKQQPKPVEKLPRRKRERERQSRECVRPKQAKGSSKQHKREKKKQGGGQTATPTRRRPRRRVSGGPAAGPSA